MSYIPRTPFRRAVDAALVKHLALAARDGSQRKVSKWDVLRDLSVAKRQYDLSDRTLSVLQALISFHPDTDLADDGAPIVVFPSNAALCERLHGMAGSTMRRHLARLVAAGLVLRRDSPNGKRFVKRRGPAPEAFGFDLSPLPRRAADIARQADVTRAEEAEMKRLRRTLILMRRDLDAFVSYGRDAAPDVLPWDAFSDLSALTARDLRRQLTLPDLREIEARLAAALNRVDQSLIQAETPNLSTRACQNEQHIQNSEKEPESIKKPRKTGEPALPLVLALCPDIATYSDREIRTWDDLNHVAQNIAPMIGIDRPTWFTAVNTMGTREASTVLAAMLQRFATIRNCGAYLRRLTEKARAGEFTCLPMLTALKAAP